MARQQAPLWLHDVAQHVTARCGELHLVRVQPRRMQGLQARRVKLRTALLRVREHPAIVDVDADRP
eukprot:10538378-Lingulodinium_polyedra.AAC.1